MFLASSIDTKKQAKYHSLNYSKIMAKLVTVVRTYFKSGNYRNNTIEIDIPDEAAELIKEHWTENSGVNSIFEGGPEDE
jgi:hypothetical protein